MCKFACFPFVFQNFHQEAQTDFTCGLDTKQVMIDNLTEKYILQR